MRLALIQQAAGPDKQENVRRGLAALERAARDGAEVVAYAELAFERFWPQVPAAGDVRGGRGLRRAGLRALLAAGAGRG